MLTEEALAEASAAVLALPLRLWQRPVLPLVGREATFGARPTVSEIQLHYLDQLGPDLHPTNGVLVSNRLRRTLWTNDRGQIQGLENPLAAHLENFVARFTGIDPRPPLEPGDMARLDVPVPHPHATALRHRTLPLEVVVFPVDPDGPLGVEVGLAAWSLPVAGYVELLEPLSPEEARAVDRRLRGG